MTMAAEQLAQLREHIDLRKAMPAFGPNTSIERLTILNATQCSFTTEIVEALLDELEAAEKRIAELEARQVYLEHIGYVQVEEGTFYLDEGMVKSAIRAAGIRINGED